MGFALTLLAAGALPASGAAGWMWIDHYPYAYADETHSWQYIHAGTGGVVVQDALTAAYKSFASRASAGESGISGWIWTGFWPWLWSADASGWYYKLAPGGAVWSYDLARQDWEQLGVPGFTWDETFDDLPNGTREDTGPTAWTSTAVLGSGGSYGVLDGAFDIAKGMPGTWLSEPIAIGGKATVTVVHEGDPDMESNDYISISVMVDGGAPVPIVANLAGYYVKRSDALEVSGSSVQVRIDTVSTGSTEHHRIDRVAVSGASLAALPPAAPLNLKATANLLSVILEWLDNSIDETGYELYRQAPGEADFSLLAVLDPDTTSYTDAGLQPASGYSYKLVAFNSVGHSAPAGPVHAMTEQVDPISPDAVPLWPLVNASFESGTSTGGWLEDDPGGLINFVATSNPVPPDGASLLRIRGPGGRIEQALYQPLAGHRYSVRAWIYSHGTIGVEDLGADQVHELSTSHGNAWQEVELTFVSTGSPALLYAKYGPGGGDSLFDGFRANNVSTEADLALPLPPKIMRYASQVIDLSRWKITLPVNDAQEIYTPALYKLDLDPWFKLVEDADGHAVQFRANHGGATTSGSKNPRSELREMSRNYHYRDSKSAAAWSNMDGLTHTLWIRQKVTHLTYVKPHVVVGQIHDASDDITVFRVEGLLADGGPGTVGVMDTHAKLWITKGDATHGYLVDPAYELGTVFTVKFIAHDGIIEYEYNGVRLPYVHTEAISGAYFKLGNYTQSNDGTAPGESEDAYAETYVYDYVITHE